MSVAAGIDRLAAAMRRDIADTDIRVGNTARLNEGGAITLFILGRKPYNAEFWYQVEAYFYCNFDTANALGLWLLRPPQGIIAGLQQHGVSYEADMPDMVSGSFTFWTLIETDTLEPPVDPTPIPPGTDLIVDIYADTDTSVTEQVTVEE